MMHVEGVDMQALLTITGSDNTGVTGIQADIKTMSAMGCDALTALTAVTVQDGQSINSIMDLPHDMIVGQVRAVVEARHPVGVKIGLLRRAETVKAVRDEVIGARHLVLVPGVMTAGGEKLMDDEAMEAWKRWLLPEATLIIIRCREAQLLLGRPVSTDDEMVEAAKAMMDMGAKAVFLRGGHQEEGRVSALLYAEGIERFYSSQNTEAWQRHGVGAALSSAVLARLAKGDDIEVALKKAHDYMHAQVVYGLEERTYTYRPSDIYNDFMGLLAEYYKEAHDVAFYVERLAISQRYLSMVTRKVVDKAPKTIIAEYLMDEAMRLLLNTRMTVAEVAWHLGFSPTAFSKWFKEQSGCTPNSVRVQR